ncbi:MAG: hypothetical protein H6579_02930 [Chitinophagales bacterium]|nr:hypothetical protein [Chitinophagales bacterium]
MKKNLLTTLSCLLLSFLFVGKANAQCNNNNFNWPLGINTTSSSSFTTISTCMYGGDYTICAVTMGQTYEWTTCGDTDFDTYITIANAAHNTFYAWNDDDCGTQSTVTWTATFTGNVHVLVSEFPCLDNTSCMTLQWRQVLGSGPTPIAITGCSGSFFDTGGTGPGASGNYSDNENIVWTICPSTPGQNIQLTFTQFELETASATTCWDYLEAYDGNSTSATYLGAYCGNTVFDAPGGGVISSTDPSGCLTFQFTSDGSNTLAGWNATISCITPGACTGSTPSCSVSPPDDCANACNLGSLSTPPPCPSTTTVIDRYCGSNIGASAEDPYSYLLGCSPSGDMAAPAIDVWYSFVATSNTMDIEIIGLNTPNLGLYEGSSCGTMIGRGCAVGTSGSGYLNVSFQAVNVGSTYYLQISGEDTTDIGDFQMNFYSYIDCDPCNVSSTLVASPAPINGTYLAGQTVQFCFTVETWDATSFNWLHGVIPTFGSGWDLSSFTPTSIPASCDPFQLLGDRYWDYYSSPITAAVSGTSYGPGFFFESICGDDIGVAPTACLGVTDSDPGNNFGDAPFILGCEWEFCWEITVDECSLGTPASLNVEVNTTADGESGSWVDLACTFDPVYSLFASVACCEAPTFNALSLPSCPNSCDGSLAALGNGTAPFSFEWRDSTGNLFRSTSGLNSGDTASSLCYGWYYITVIDNNACTRTDSFYLNHEVYSAISFNTPLEDDTICAGELVSFTADVSGADVSYQWQVFNGSFWQNVTNGGFYSGVTTPTLNVLFTNASYDGRQFRVLLSDSCNMMDTAYATLRVNSLTPLPGLVNLNICEWGIFSLGSGSAPLNQNYQWQFNDNQGSGWQNIPETYPYSGTQTSFLLVNGAPFSLDEDSIRLLIFNTSCDTLISQNMIFVDQSGSIILHPINAQICENGDTSFYVITNGIEDYQWQIYNPGLGIYENISNSAIYGGTNDSVLVLSNVPFALNNSDFRVMMHDECGDILYSNNVNLLVNPASNATLDTTICSGDNFVFNGTIYDEFNLNGTEYFIASNGCDSIITINVSIFPPSLGTLDTTICSGDFFVFNGTIYDEFNQSGTEVLLASTGCDSTVTVTVSFFPPNISTLDTAICAGEFIVINGSIYDEFNTSGTEVLVGSNACDSIINVNLTILTASVSIFDTTICNGASFVFNGTTYDASNLSGTEVFTAANGCDSVVTVTVTESPLITGVFDTTICNGASFVFNGTTYDASNLKWNRSAANGCDSVVTTESPLITLRFVTFLLSLMVQLMMLLI